MTREQMEKKNEVFFGLAEVYSKMSGNKVEVIVDRYVVWADDAQILFTTSDAIVKFMTTEIREYLKEV